MHAETTKLRERYNPEGSELRQLQMRMLDILIVIVDICDRHNITYWISGGTLLGAVVHDGFIPWDDDIDIEMIRGDYKKLLKILPSELPPHLYLQTPKEKGYAVPISKVRDRNSIVYMKDEDTNHYPVQGFFVDIVPVERSYMWMKRLLDATYGRSFRRLKKRDFSTLKSIFEYCFSIVLYPISCFLIFLCRIICAFFKPEKLVYGFGINASHAQYIDDVLPTSKIAFEGINFSAPNHPNRYLFTQYRCDCMTIPPEDKRPQHFIRVEYL